MSVTLVMREETWETSLSLGGRVGGGGLCGRYNSRESKAGYILALKLPALCLHMLTFVLQQIGL